MKGRWLAFSAIVIVGILLAISISTYWTTRPETLTGTVDHKTLCATKNDCAIGLVDFYQGGLHSFYPDVDKLVAGMDANSTISDELVAHLRGLGYEPYYVCSIRLDTPDPVNHLEKGQAVGYIVDVTSFNNAKIDGRVTFEVRQNEVVQAHGVRLAMT